MLRRAPAGAATSGAAEPVPRAGGAAAARRPPQPQLQSRGPPQAHARAAPQRAAGLPRDKYERLALMEAGWGPAAAAAARQARPPAALSVSSSASSSSLAAQRRGGVGAPVGPKKVDRVNRWRELEEQWSRDK